MKSSNERITIRIYTDFDGTLTSAPGHITVQSNFYKKLQTNPDDKFDQATFKSLVEIIPILKEELKNDNCKFNIKIQSLAFLHRILALPKENAEIDLNIEIILLSRNRREYIEALFKYNIVEAKQNFSNQYTDDILKSIKIYDFEKVKQLDGKAPVIEQLEQTIETADFYLTIDDDKNDLKSMAESLAKLKPDRIVKPFLVDSRFNWIQVHIQIAEFLDAQKEKLHTPKP